jgi:ABC-type Fe3+-hydroxamate transport system substrate-binding protein
MKVFKDQMGNEIVLSGAPRRIVSLVPSQTELLFDLGLESEIAGITRFCIHPHEKVKYFPKIGGTKKFDFEKISSLNPDLILGNKEENYREGIEVLQKKFPVWMSDINDVYDALFMIQSLGEMTGREDQAYLIAFSIKKKLEGYCAPYRLNAAYFIWKAPFMCAGGETFIDEMLKIAGFRNVFATHKRYPVVSEEDIRKCDADLILLSSEPYPFVEKHLDEFRQLCPKALVLLVDGEMFSWYGSRLQYSAEYFSALEQKISSWLSHQT